MERRIPDSNRRTHDESTAIVVLYELLQVAEDGSGVLYFVYARGISCSGCLVCECCRDESCKYRLEQVTAGYMLLTVSLRRNVSLPAR